MLTELSDVSCELMTYSFAKDNVILAIKQKLSVLFIFGNNDERFFFASVTLKIANINSIVLFRVIANRKTIFTV